MTPDSHVVPHASGGRRLRWHDLPAPVRAAAVEQRLGAAVVREHGADTGFSPGLASVLVTSAGTRTFVKAAREADEPECVRLHRAEARVTAALPRHLPVPRLLWLLDDSGWVVAAYEVVDGRPTRRGSTSLTPRRRCPASSSGRSSCATTPTPRSTSSHPGPSAASTSSPPSRDGQPRRAPATRSCTATCAPTTCSSPTGGS